MGVASKRLRLVLAFVLIVGFAAAIAVGSGSAQEQEETQIAASPVPVGPAIPPELTDFANDWPTAQGNLGGTRAASGSSIDSTNVANLEVAWTFTIEASSAFGGMSAPPLIVGETVYIQDMLSNVFALDRATGAVIWERAYDIGTVGPNGLAIGYGMIYGTLGDTAEVFALDAATGAEVWRIKLSNNAGEGVDMAPLVYDNTVYVSTVPGNNLAFYRGGQKGILYALDASSGHTVWQFDTTTDNLWGNARTNSGGGLWYPPSIDEAGNLYFGVGNAAPWPGNTEYPNAASRPGDNDYASSMVSLDPATGAIRWYHNAKPHDIFDLDFQNTPVLATTTIDGTETMLSIGSGKTGTVVAANAETGEVVWSVEVGLHENDTLQEIPEGETIQVLPGVLGGVETPMAYANGVVFVPVVNLSTEFTSTSLVAESLDFTAGTGQLVALNVADGSVLWTADLPQSNFGGATVANDVVFTSALDGLFRAYSAETGDLLWSYQAGAGFNAPPAIAGDMVIVGAAGIFLPGEDAGDVPTANQLIAFKIGSGSATPEATPAS